MWKLFLTFFTIIMFFMVLSPLSIAQQWRGGNGTLTIPGSSNAALIGYNTYNQIVQPLDSLLSNYCNEYLVYASSSTMTVHSGACVVSNSQGSVRLFMMDTANTTITSANLDTGSITASTTYYVYSTAATTSTYSSTYYISASNTAPSGQTYYYQIGSFTTDSNSNFSLINNNMALGTTTGALVSKSTGVAYLALTDVEAGCYGNPSSGQSAVSLDIGTTSSPAIVVGECGSNPSNVTCSFSWLVPKGDYYEFSGSVSGVTCYSENTSK